MLRRYAIHFSDGTHYLTGSERILSHEFIKAIRLASQEITSYEVTIRTSPVVVVVVSTQTSWSY